MSYIALKAWPPKYQIQWGKRVYRYAHPCIMLFYRFLPGIVEKTVLHNTWLMAILTFLFFFHCWICKLCSPLLMMLAVFLLWSYHMHHMHAWYAYASGDFGTFGQPFCTNHLYLSFFYYSWMPAVMQTLRWYKPLLTPWVDYLVTFNNYRCLMENSKLLDSRSGFSNIHALLVLSYDFR